MEFCWRLDGLVVAVLECTRTWDFCWSFGVFGDGLDGTFEVEEFKLTIVMLPEDGWGTGERRLCWLKFLCLMTAVSLSLNKIGYWEQSFTASCNRVDWDVRSVLGKFSMMNSNASWAFSLLFLPIAERICPTKQIVLGSFWAVRIKSPIYSWKTAGFFSAKRNSTTKAWVAVALVKIKSKNCGSLSIMSKEIPLFVVLFDLMIVATNCSRIFLSTMSHVGKMSMMLRVRVIIADSLDTS